MRKETPLEGRKFKEQFQLRLPDGMRADLKALAKTNHRSLNSEILLHLEQALAVTRTQKRGTANAGV